jgi:hypothetical protein
LQATQTVEDLNHREGLSREKHSEGKIEGLMEQIATLKEQITWLQQMGFPLRASST